MTPAPMSWAIALAALAAGVPSTAQAPAAPAPAPSDTTIVVTGKAEPPAHKDVYDQAQDVTRIDPRLVYEVALPRFASPLCPGVMGLKDTYAQAMADRMRADAARLRLPLARPGCAPNVLVAFVDSGQATLGELQRKHPALFELVPESERQEMLTGEAPVRVWNNIAVRWTGNGAPPAGWPKEKASFWASDREPAQSARHPRDAGAVRPHRGAGPDADAAGRLRHDARAHSTRPPTGDAPMATILNLFAGGRDKGPAELTRFDLAYLRSLYREGASRPAVSKLLAVRREADRRRHPTGANRACLQARRPCQAQRPP